MQFSIHFYSFSIVHLSQILDVFNASFQWMLFVQDDDDDDDQSEGVSTAHIMLSSGIQYLLYCIDQWYCFVSRCGCTNPILMSKHLFEISSSSPIQDSMFTYLLIFKGIVSWENFHLQVYISGGYTHVHKYYMAEFFF